SEPFPLQSFRLPHTLTYFRARSLLAPLRRNENRTANDREIAARRGSDGTVRDHPRRWRHLGPRSNPAAHGVSALLGGQGAVNFRGRLYVAESLFHVVGV